MQIIDFGCDSRQTIVLSRHTGHIEVLVQVRNPHEKGHIRRGSAFNEIKMSIIKVYQNDVREEAT